MSSSGTDTVLRSEHYVACIGWGTTLVRKHNS